MLRLDGCRAAEEARPSEYNHSHTGMHSMVTLGPCTPGSSAGVGRPPDLPCKPILFKQRQKAVSEEDRVMGTTGSGDEKTGLQLSSSDYNLPVDAVPSGHSHLGKKGEFPQTRKISFNISAGPGEGHYTDVFDKVQRDTIQVVGSPPQPATPSQPPSEAKGSSNPSYSVVQTRKNGTVVSEGSRTLPRSANAPSDDVTLDPGSSKAERRMSLPQSQLPSSKELVELDPQRRVFRLESQKRKREPAGVGEANSIDATGEGGRVEYSVVNMADKLKYRTNDGSTKTEGSGAPARYVPNGLASGKAEDGVTA